MVFVIIILGQGSGLYNNIADNDDQLISVNFVSIFIVPVQFATSNKSYILTGLPLEK